MFAEFILNKPLKNVANMDKTTPATLKEKSIAGILKDSIMVILTLVFVLLYAAAFTGKFDPLKDNTLLLRLEPIILILIAYYFGRLPSRQNEKSLKDEIARQTQKTDAAQYAKEKANQERETLEERIRNAKTTLKAIAPPKPMDIETLKAAIRILDSWPTPKTEEILWIGKKK